MIPLTMLNARVIVRYDLSYTTNARLQPTHADFYDTFIHRNAVNFKNIPHYGEVALVYMRDPIRGRPSGPWRIGESTAV